MNAAMPLYSNARLSAQSVAHPDDVIVTKRSLQRLGYYEPWDGRVSSFTDRALFNWIANFQRDAGLTVDGYMDPGGETATEIGRQLFPANGEESDRVSISLLRRGPPSQEPPRNRPPKEQCEEQFESDNAECRRISAANGPIAATLCYGSAMARYAACLHGTPIFDLSPLYRPPPRED